MGTESTIDHITGEHPLIQVVQHKPFPGRRPFAFGVVFLGIAAILAVLLIGLPLNSYLDSQKRAAHELNCRNAIGNALQEAQATLSANVARGLTAVVRKEDTAGIIAQIDADRARISSLGALRSQAVDLCHDDPTFRPPPALLSP
jgi:uncharacterized membrane protein YdfJ with MMPL/SSD domain